MDVFVGCQFGGIDEFLALGDKMGACMEKEALVCACGDSKAVKEEYIVVCFVVDVYSLGVAVVTGRAMVIVRTVLNK